MPFGGAFIFQPGKSTPPPSGWIFCSKFFANFPPHFPLVFPHFPGLSMGRQVPFPLSVLIWLLIAVVAVAIVTCAARRRRRPHHPSIIINQRPPYYFWRSALTLPLALSLSLSPPFSLLLQRSLLSLSLISSPLFSPLSLSCWLIL